MVLLCIDIGVFFLAPRHLLSNRPGGPSRHGGGRTEQDRAGASWRQPSAGVRPTWACLPLTAAHGLAYPSGWALLDAQTTTLCRLIGSSVMVEPASVSRRHERPSRIAVSRQSGKSRPPRSAARLQGRVASGFASPPPGRTDEPGQLTVSSASLAWRALCLLADTQMLPGRGASARGQWSRLPPDPRQLPRMLGELVRSRSLHLGLPPDRGTAQPSAAPSQATPLATRSQRLQPQ
jgi:hypothetical protein